VCPVDTAGAPVAVLKGRDQARAIATAAGRRRYSEGLQPTRFLNSEEQWS
jgi:hypothetical protein